MAQEHREQNNTGAVSPTRKRELCSRGYSGYPKGVRTYQSLVSPVAAQASKIAWPRGPGCPVCCQGCRVTLTKATHQPTKPPTPPYKPMWCATHCGQSLPTKKSSAAIQICTKRNTLNCKGSRTQHQNYISSETDHNSTVSGVLKHLSASMGIHRGLLKPAP